MIKKILAIIGALLFVACQNLDMEIEEYDVDPPADYDPTYITSVKDINNTPISDPKLAITRVDPFSSEKVRLYVHLIEGDTTFLSGADLGKWKDIWCDAVEIRNGVEYKIDGVEIKEGNSDDRPPIAMSIVMDHSGSMGETRANIVQSSVEKLAQGKLMKDRISLIKYDSKVITEVPLTSDKQELASGFATDGLWGYGGMTATADGIMRGLDELKNASANELKTVLVFTDGIDNSSSYTKDQVINRANRENTIICAFDYGYNITQNFLSDISTETNGFYNHIYLTDELDDVFKDVYNRFNHFYMMDLAFEEYGVHTVRVKVCIDDTTLVREITFDNTPQVGQINLLKVYFDFNRSTIKEESKDAIERVAKLMKALPQVKIELRGHTDSKNSTGDPEYNVKLSQKRADAVKSELVDRGIEGSRITAKGYGESIPVADNSTEEGRAMNRRTEFVITSK